jgi:multidrug resistance efflux pump
MRFQQSGLRPYDRECAVKPPAKVRMGARRLWWIRPRTVLFAIAALIAAAFVSDHLWIRGKGIVAGELTAESPIVQARLERLFVKCLDHVKRGQRLAEFYNEAAVQFAAQQLQQLETQLAQARAGIDIADREAEAASKLVDAQLALLNQQKAVLVAEDQLKKQNFIADLVWQQAKAAVERADAEARAAEFVYESKRADQKMAEVNADILQKRIESYRNSPELTGHFYLTAAKDGVVTECTAREGEVIAARTPILSIFNPDDTYAVVFFEPSAAGKIARGQTYEISIEGARKPLTGTVTDFYPELSALPSSLTRFFWQREMWSQYVPVRLDFTDLNEDQRSKLFAWAQVSVSRWGGWNAAEIVSSASALSRRVFDRLSGRSRPETSDVAQQARRQ